jgi:16S rRNA (adenine1518-N6/adenine1519-N6)-dimethyltransferase
LFDPEYLRAIVRFADIARDSTVLEIGPGLGFLTEILVGEGISPFIAELEPSFCRYLAEERHLVRPERVLQGDVCNVRLTDVFDPDESAVVVGNLPYSRSSDILLWCIEERARVNRCVFLLQRDVVERLVAPPGERATGVLSVQLHLLADVCSGPEVPPEAFYPAPKVWSQVVSIRFLEQPREYVASIESFVRTVRAGFSHRRKTIRNSLVGSGQLGAALVDKGLAETGISASRRPENLTLKEWADLTNAIGLCRKADGPEG